MHGVPLNLLVGVGGGGWASLAPRFRRPSGLILPFKKSSILDLIHNALEHIPRHI